MKVSGIIKALEVSISPSTSAYHANDVIGGLLELDNVPSASGGLLIQAISLVDDDNEGAELTVHIFDRKPSVIADHAAFTPSFADLQKRVSKVSIASTDYETINSLKIVDKDDVNDLAGNTQLWLYLVCVGTPTYTANTSIFVRLFVTD
ncbi:MAG: hypothetical protein IBX69_13140 [Anaerolineales bacterium]|nr:hypothetical protein [Anaerolineales bacterium]